MHDLLSIDYSEYAVLPQTVGQLVSTLLGESGISGGQYLDLKLQSRTTEITPETILTMIDGKTGSLFELAVCLGWAMSCGSILRLERLDTIRELGRTFGRYYQIKDDVHDFSEDGMNNYARVFGKQSASEKIREYRERYIGLLNTLGIDSDFLRNV